jgi:hypothetical protein
MTKMNFVLNNRELGMEILKHEDCLEYYASHIGVNKYILKSAVQDRVGAIESKRARRDKRGSTPTETKGLLIWLILATLIALGAS